MFIHSGYSNYDNVIFDLLNFLFFERGMRIGAFSFDANHSNGQNLMPASSKNDRR